MLNKSCPAEIDEVIICLLSILTSICAGRGLLSILTSICAGRGLLSILSSMCAGRGLLSILSSMCAGHKPRPAHIDVKMLNKP
jgi:hypothetical protein